MKLTAFRNLEIPVMQMEDDLAAPFFCGTQPGRVQALHVFFLQRFFWESSRTHTILLMVNLPT